MKKSCIRYAVHKKDSEIFGSLCTYKSEAEDLLEDLKKNIIHMPQSEKDKYIVAKVEISWNENEAI